MPQNGRVEWENKYLSRDWIKTGSSRLVCFILKESITFYHFFHSQRHKDVTLYVRLLLALFLWHFAIVLLPALIKAFPWLLCAYRNKKWHFLCVFVCVFVSVSIDKSWKITKLWKYHIHVTERVLCFLLSRIHKSFDVKWLLFCPFILFHSIKSNTSTGVTSTL